MKRISFQLQCITWRLEKALSNLPYDLYDISDEVGEQVNKHSLKEMIFFLLVVMECFKVVFFVCLCINQVELARSQLRRAMQRYGSLNSNKFLNGLSEPMERDAFSNVKIKAEEEKLEGISETVVPFGEVKKQLRKSSSISLAFYLSKDADTDRLDKMVTKNTDESKKSDKLTIPVDFLCPVSLELMKDPVIVATGQVWLQVCYFTYCCCLVIDSFVSSMADLREGVHTEMDRLWELNMSKDSAETRELYADSKLRPQKLDLPLVR